MKVKLTTLMLAAAALLASCSQDDGLQQNTVNPVDGLTPVTLNVALPGEGMKTRAITADNDEQATRAYLEILVKEAQGTYGKVTGDIAGVHTMVANGSSFTLSGIYLDPTEDYRFLFWADNATATAAAPTDLESVAYTDGSIAFAACVDWGTEKSNAVSATLKHAVSKFTLKTTTDLWASIPVHITIPATYTAYNVSTGAVTGAATVDKQFEITTPAEITGTPEGTEVFSFYTLVDEGTQELTVYHDGYELQVANVPLAPNKHTVLVGDVRYIGWEETTFTAGFDGTWGGTETKIIGLDISEDGNTYTVSSKEALLVWATAVQSNPSLNCTLAADIHLTGTNNWTPLEFSGTFDGAGHAINGLNIESNGNIGFISILREGGTVKNLIVTNALIKLTGTDFSWVGGIVGVCWGGTIQGCGFSGEISTEEASVYGGGIAGGVQAASIVTACWSTANIDVSISNTGAIFGASFDTPSITACYYMGVTRGIGLDMASVADNIRMVNNSTTSWTDAADAMNTNLTEGYQWVVNTGDNKDNVPLVLEKSN